MPPPQNNHCTSSGVRRIKAVKPIPQRVVCVVIFGARTGRPCPSSMIWRSSLNVYARSTSTSIFTASFRRSSRAVWWFGPCVVISRCAVSAPFTPPPSRVWRAATVELLVLSSVATKKTKPLHFVLADVRGDCRRRVSRFVVSLFFHFVLSGMLIV